MSKNKNKGSLGSEASSKEEKSFVEDKVEMEASQPLPVGDDEEAFKKAEASRIAAKRKEKPKRVEILSDEEKKALDETARKLAREEAKQEAEDLYLAAAKKKAKAEERAKAGVDEEMVRHTVNLSAAADRHIINGKHYINGHTYEVPKSLADVMRDTEHRGHVQEEIRKGSNKNEYGFRNRNGIQGKSSGVVTV